MKLIILSVPELEEIISRVSDETAKKISKHNPPTPPETATPLVSRSEAARYLGITTVTLDRYCRGANSILTAYRLGGTIRLKRSEIEQALKIVKTIKGRRFDCL